MRGRFFTFGIAVLVFFSMLISPLQTVENSDEYFIKVTTDKYCYSVGETVKIVVEGYFVVGSGTILGLVRPIILNESEDYAVEPIRYNGAFTMDIGWFVGPKNYTWNQKYIIYDKDSQDFLPPLIPPSGEQVPEGIYTIWFGWWSEWTTGFEAYLKNLTTPAEIMIGDCGMGPIADAGPDQEVNEGDVVQFDGSGSKGGGGGWSIETVDSAGLFVRSTSIALDSSGYAHISYYNENNFDLKYARWIGSGWNIETVPNDGRVGGYISLALDSNDNAHISYFDESNFDLKYAKWTGSGWSIETVDRGHFTSIALDSSDYAHISYYGGNDDLKYARWTGSGWGIETVDSTGHVGYHTSIALDSSGYPHISYFDWTNHDLKYARWTGSGWSIETVDSAGWVGCLTSIALDSNDYAHVSYFDSDHGDLKYARWTGSEWSMETVDSAGWVGEYASIALDSSGHAHISYLLTNDYDLKYARWTGSGWITEIVDSVGKVGWRTSIALDSSDYAHISYWDKTNYGLKYARWTGGGNIVSYEWDFTSDGIYDYQETPSSAPDGTFDGKIAHIYGDNGAYTATLRITDETGVTDTDTCNVTVNNVAPSIIDAKAMAIDTYVDITLRLAGEKWHDASMYLYEDGTEIGSVTVVRYPGSPDDQSATIEAVYLDLTKEYSAKVIYTPEDDPINGQPNGANPAWIILTFEDGSEKRIHHTFNVKHPETWEWDVELNQYLMEEITIEAIATDPGSDDLTFNWSFGSSTTYYNNAPINTPDPYPSPNGIFPFEAKDVVEYIYSGSVVITLTVLDDDGGIATVPIALT